MFACIAIALAGTSVMHFWWALLLLGVGWNFLYIGGTTLLTETYRPEEKAKVQGSNDFLVFAVQGDHLALVGRADHARRLGDAEPLGDPGGGGDRARHRGTVDRFTQALTDDFGATGVPTPKTDTSNQRRQPSYNCFPPLSEFAQAIWMTMDVTRKQQEPIMAEHRPASPA